MSEEYGYVGGELDLFADALNWKKYYVSLVEPFIRGKKVLEVGAGLGEVTRHLCSSEGGYQQWLCLEPDTDMANKISEKIQQGILPKYCEARALFLNDLDRSEKFDTILYIDVLEHIEQDGQEFRDAMDFLNPGGVFIVVSPAHQWLYTPFDKAIGHFRRYNRKSLLDLTPPGAKCLRFQYIDSIGLFASLANKLLLKQSNPQRSQIMFWDRVLLPMSRIFDKVFLGRFGKNVFAVWVKQ